MVASPKKTFRVTPPPRHERPGGAAAGPPAITRYGVGLDVHKNSVMACVCAQTDRNAIVEVRMHRFKNDARGLEEMCRFLARYHPVAHYLMECTGVYHFPVYQALARAFPGDEDRIVAMNPLLVHRRLGDLGNKNDKADARSMAELAFYDRLLRPSYVGLPAFFHLRDTIRQYHGVTKDLTRLKNRMHRVLSAVNQKFPFNFNKEWCLQLLDHYLEPGASLAAAYETYLAAREAAGRGTAVLEGKAAEVERHGSVVLPPGARFNLEVLLAQFLYQQTVAASFLARAERAVLADPEFRDGYRRLIEIPGFGAVSALTVLVELGDYRRFRGWRALVKFCGVVPTIEDSGEHHARGHVNRFTNKNLRRSLTQVATTLVNHPDGDTDLHAFARRQRRDRGLPFKKAVVKVAQKVARVVYYVLVAKVDYDPHHEQVERKRRDLAREMASKGSWLEAPRVRALRRDISTFFADHWEFTNAKSRAHLKSGYLRLLRTARERSRRRKGQDGKK